MPIYAFGTHAGSIADFRKAQIERNVAQQGISEEEAGKQLDEMIISRFGSYEAFRKLSSPFWQRVAESNPLIEFTGIPNMKGFWHDMHPKEFAKIMNGAKK